jgi:hypothetical protein
MAQKSCFLQAVPRRQGQRVRLGRRPGLARRQASRCETASFGAPFCTESDHCTNTGSGQTQRTFTFLKGKRFLQVEASTPKVQWLTFSKSLASATAVATHNPSRPRPLKETQSLRRPTGSDTTTPTSPVQARNRHFLSHLYIKCIILPRQARDKHRENSKKCRFPSDLHGKDFKLPKGTTDAVGMAKCAATCAQDSACGGYVFVSGAAKTPTPGGPRCAIKGQSCCPGAARGGCFSGIRPGECKHPHPHPPGPVPPHPPPPPAPPPYTGPPSHVHKAGDAYTFVHLDPGKAKDEVINDGPFFSHFPPTERENRAFAKTGSGQNKILNI